MYKRILITCKMVWSEGKPKWPGGGGISRECLQSMKKYIYKPVNISPSIRNSPLGHHVFLSGYFSDFIPS